MKKIFTILLTLAVANSLFAQPDCGCSPKKSDNLYLDFGAGIMTVFNGGANPVTPNLNLSLGQYVTPIWGWRAGVGGLWQSLNEQSNGYQMKNKTFAEINLDATLNLINLFGTPEINRPFNLFVFGGPTISFSSAVSSTQTVHYEWQSATQGTGTELSLIPTGIENKFVSEGAKARVGATVGLSFNFKLSNHFLLGADGRYGVAPSIFGWGSDCRTAESTLRVNARLTYVFGGLK